MASEEIRHTVTYERFAQLKAAYVLRSSRPRWYRPRHDGDDDEGGALAGGHDEHAPRARDAD